MSRILLVGVGPMPGPDEERVHAPGLRLAAFLDALRPAATSLAVAEFAFSGTERHAPAALDGVERRVALPDGLKEAVQQLTALLAEWKPDGVVALTDIGALAVVRTGWAGPLYVDYNGHPMTERQQLGFAHGNDASLAGQWLNVLPVLLRADRFSTCSTAQRHALLGELGSVGRLNHLTCGRTMVDPIPPPLPFREPMAITSPTVLEDLGIPRGGHYLLSTGGFNTWFDEATLFAGLEQAMDTDPRLRFLCTGGPIPGHVEGVYTRFHARVAASPHRDRYHLLGWVPHATMIDLMLVADAAVNVDHWSLEGELGFRNRLLGWLWAGARVITTTVSHPAIELAAEGLARAIPPADPAALARAINEETARGRLPDLEGLRRRLLAEYGGELDMAPLQEWARAPRRAPDRESTDTVENGLADFQRRALAAHEAEAIRRHAAEAAARLEGNRLVRLALRLDRKLAECVRRLRG